MWPEQQVNLKQYKWACLSKTLHPPRSSKCLGETMAAHRVPVCLLPWLGTVCFALLRGRTVNLGCVEAGEVSWEIFKGYVVAWEKKLHEQSSSPYYTRGSLQGVFIYKSFWMKLVTPCPHCTHSLQAVCCGRCSYSWVSGVSEDAGQVARYHLTLALLECIAFLWSALGWDRERCFRVLQWSSVLLVPPCLGSGHSLGSRTHIHITLLPWMPWPKPPTCIHLRTWGGVLGLGLCCQVPEVPVKVICSSFAGFRVVVCLCWLFPILWSAVRHEQPDGFLQQLLINVLCLRWFDSCLIKGVPTFVGGAGCAKVAVLSESHWLISFSFSSLGRGTC